MKPETRGLVWKKVKAAFNQPTLKDPIYTPKLEGGAHYDFRKREILVSEGIITEMVRSGVVTQEEALEGILIHETGHYMVFPKNLATLILTAKMANDFFSKVPVEDQNFIIQTFMDMVNDTASVLRSNTVDKIIKARIALQKDLGGVDADVREVMLAYLHYQADREFVLKDELKEYLEEMKKIDFRTVHEQTLSLRLAIWAFGGIILKMLEKNDKSKKSGYGMPGDCDVKEILKNVTRDELKEALRDLSYKLNKGEFDKLKEWLKKNGLPEHILKSLIPANGSKGIGTSIGELPVDQDVLEYYLDLSKKYPIAIAKKLLPSGKIIQVHAGVEKWRVGEDSIMALPLTTGGKFLPGITRRIQREPRKIRSTGQKTPHLLLVVDSSGSMPNPKSFKSHAVLGGYCAARSYHIQGSHVGVINFSGSSFYLPYTRKLEHALGAISAYQGGGTTVDLEMIKKMLGNEMYELYKSVPESSMRPVPREAMKKEISLNMPQFEEAFTADSVDVIMITDGGIWNLNELLDLFEEKSQINRASVILAHGYAQEISERKGKINVHKIDKPEDILTIAIKEATKGLSEFAARFLG